MKSRRMFLGGEILSLLLLVAALLPSAGPSSAAAVGEIVSTRDVVCAPDTDGASRAEAANTLLGEYTFDNGGLPDAQGWTSRDNNAEPRRFHIDDFAGLAGYAPLSGSQSLWCGSATEFATPGYGNVWKQGFRSDIFSVTGNVTVSFLVSYDTEANYDNAYLEYDPDPSGGAENWQFLAMYTGNSGGAIAASEVISSASLPAGEVRLRFRFHSDGAWSDQDGFFDSHGAIIIDNLTVSDGSGVVDSQDFETEGVGDQATTDGNWSAFDLTGFGEYAALHDGTGVLQQANPNPSYLWGFFTDPAIANYGCAGYPAQGVVPYGNGSDGWIHEDIVSPAIPYVGTGSLTFLEFDVYRDLALSALVHYDWHVRFFDGTSWTSWVNDNTVYYGSDADWLTHQIELIHHSPIAENTITHLQVALGVIDMCPVWGGIQGDCQCHSNGPLFDNVKVYRSDGTVDVAIQQFVAAETERGVNLEWEVVADEEIAGFELYRRNVADNSYTPIHGASMIDAARRSVVDADVVPATTYEYTLKVITPNGTEFLSTPVRVTTRTLALALDQNEPNPFNPITRIAFSLDRKRSVSLVVYDITGRVVRTLLDHPLTAGRYSEAWDGRDDQGREVASGLYFYRLTADSRSLTRKMVLLK